MLRTLKNKAFSIIELLVVIVIIIVIVVIAYPQISNYLIDREVKSEVNRFVKYFKDTFQHGGVSLEEMVIPLAILDAK